MKEEKKPKSGDRKLVFNRVTGESKILEYQERVLNKTTGEYIPLRRRPRIIRGC